MLRIQGKEDSILQYEEEAEDFKDKNYRQKEKVHSPNSNSTYAHTYNIILSEGLA